MSYASEYINLLDRLAASRTKRLADIAAISGQSMAANAQIWGQLPGQLADIANNAIGQYQKQKQFGLQERRQATLDESARRRADAQDETNRINAEKLDVMARSAQTTADRAEASAKTGLQKQLDDHLKEFGRGYAKAMEDAAEGPEGFDSNQPILKSLADRWNEAHGTTITVPERGAWTPEVGAQIANLVKTAKAGLPADEVMTVSPGAVVVSKSNPNQPIFTAPTAPVRPVQVPTQQGGKNVTQFVVPEEGLTLPAPIPTRPAGGAGQMSADTGAPVVLSPPDERTRNKPFPGTRLTFGTVWEQGEDWVLTGKETDSSRSADPKVKIQNAAIRNTGTAMVKDGSSLPQLRYEYAALAGAGKGAVKKYINTKAYAEGMLLGLDRARELSGSYTRTSVPLANEVKVWFDRNLKGDTTLAEFDIWAFNTIRDYAKATSGSAESIQALTDDQVKLASMLLGVQQNPAQFERAAATMTNDVKNFLTKQRDAVVSVNESIVGLLDTTFGKPYLVNVFDPKSTSGTPLIGIAKDGKRVQYKTKADLDADIRDGLVTADVSAGTRKTTGSWGSNPFKKK